MTYQRTINPHSPLEHEGRIGRTRFIVTSVIAQMGVFFIGFLAADAREPLPLFFFLLGLPLQAIAVCAAIKRLHDIGKSGWYWLMLLLPFVNFFYFLYLAVQDGTDGPNQYGERLVVDKPPKEKKRFTASFPSIKIETQEPASATNFNLEEQLRKLKDLYDQGLMDEEAYKKGQQAAVQRFSSR